MDEMIAERIEQWLMEMGEMELISDYTKVQFADETDNPPVEAFAIIPMGSGDRFCHSYHQFCEEIGIEYFAMQFGGVIYIR